MGLFIKQIFIHFIHLIIGLNLVLVDLPFSSSSAHAKKKKHREEHETEHTCGKENQKPSNGDEQNCCEGLEWNPSTSTCLKPEPTPRKRCDSADAHDTCGPKQACFESEPSDLYDDDDKYDDKVDELEEKEESFSPKLTRFREDGTCFGHQQCASGNCVSKSMTKKRSNKVSEFLTKLISTVTFQRKCQPMYICRCAEEYETPIAKSECCSGLVKDPEGKCVDKSMVEWQFSENEPREAGLAEHTCSVIVNPVEQYNYLQTTFKLRSLEFLTATAGGDDCLGFNKKVKAVGDFLKSKRMEITKNFNLKMKEIKQERNNLVNAKFDLQQAEQERSIANADSFIAAERVTGADMIKLLIKEQELMMSYEQSLSLIYDETMPKYQALAEEWAAIDPKKKGKRCRGYTGWPFGQQKNKRRWMYRYKVKARHSGNVEILKDKQIKYLISKMGGTGKQTKSSYFLTDPLMPGDKSFNNYGNKGRYRRKLGIKKGFLGSVITGLTMATLFATGGVLFGYQLASGVAGAGSGFEKWVNSINKKNQDDEQYLAGYYNDIIRSLMTYFSNPAIENDIELGIQKACISSNFKQGVEYFQDDKSYKTEDDYYSDEELEGKAPASTEETNEEEEEEEFNEMDGENIDEFEDDESIGNDPIAEALEKGNHVPKEKNKSDKIVHEEGKRDSVDENGELLKSPTCMKSMIALSELQKITFTQSWMYSYNPKRTYKQFAGNYRHNFLISTAADFSSASAYLKKMSGFAGMRGGLRSLSIACLEKRLAEIEGYKGDGGVIADAGKYENEKKDVEWQKSQQASLDCKNCNLTGRAKSYKVNINSSTNSTMTSKSEKGKMIPHLFNQGMQDWDGISKKYAIARQAMLDRSKKIKQQFPEATAENEKIQAIYSKFGGANPLSLEAMGINVPAEVKADFMDESQTAQTNATPQTMSTPNEALAGAELDKGAMAKSEMKNSKMKKANINNLFGEDDEVGSDPVSKTGLSRQEEKQMLEEIENEKENYVEHTGDTLFQKVTKAYIRSAYPRFMSRKRQIASEAKEEITPEKKDLYEKLKNFHENSL
jgi:hypothetical protein